MTAKGSELIFISRILRDGSGVEAVKDQAEAAYLQNAEFRLNRLSITYDTYIASSFNSYVVKKKEAVKPPSRKEEKQ